MKLITIRYNIHNAPPQQEAAFIAILSRNGVHKQQHIDSMLILGFDDSELTETIRQLVESVFSAAVLSSGIYNLDVGTTAEYRPCETYVMLKADEHTKLLANQFGVLLSQGGKALLN